MPDGPGRPVVSAGTGLAEAAPARAPLVRCGAAMSLLPPAAASAMGRNGDRADAGRARVLGFLKRHGWNATSFQVLEPGFRYWFDPADRGCVAYSDTGGAWVVAGAPIAAHEDLSVLALAFSAAADAAGRRVSFFGTERRFVDRAALDAMVLGEQPVWDPHDWEGTVRASRSLREQLRRARAKGVHVRRVGAAEVDGPLRPAFEALGRRWLAGRPMAPMGFLVKLHLFSFIAERRWFVAERDGQLCAALVCVPVYSREGWLFEDLLRDPDAPNGTADLLVDAAMRDLAADGATYATLGLAPLAGGVNGWMRAARAWGAPFYDFEGVRAFKARLKPKRWEPIFLSFPKGQPGAVAVVDTLRAFAEGGLLRFGLDTVRRDPARWTRLGALLRLPWGLTMAWARGVRGRLRPVGSGR
jgi:lysylphosphatidylglycerol synthetase-like protein (DUF2156 family)